MEKLSSTLVPGAKKVMDCWDTAPGTPKQWKLGNEWYWLLHLKEKSKLHILGKHGKAEWEDDPNLQGAAKDDQKLENSHVYQEPLGSKDLRAPTSNLLSC